MAEDTREKDLARREKARADSVSEYYARSEAAKPTPTPEECDRAKIGLNVDEKEHDGSDPEEVTQRRVMESRIPGNNPYDNRSLTTEPVKRGPGRPPSQPTPTPEPVAPKAPEPTKPK